MGYIISDEDYVLTPYQDRRGKPGRSGMLLLATPKDGGKKLLVKHQHPANVANEFVACSIGKLMGVNCPQAFLMKSSKMRCAVGIEYFEDAHRFEMADAPDDDIAGIVALHALTMNVDDSTQMQAIDTENGLKIITYDFANAFYVDNDAFQMALRLPQKQAISVMRKALDTYENSLFNSLDIVRITNAIAKRDITEASLAAQKKALSITQEQIHAITDALCEVFPVHIAVFYEMIVEKIVETIRAEL